MRPGKENYYPLTLFLATVWIWFYTYIIVWFTYQVTNAINLHFSIVPMIIYPFGIALRDQKKFKDLRMALNQFKETISDQKVSLAETYSGPIFQITGLLGTAWLLFMSTSSEQVKFNNEGI
mmetsp:Transcript_43216/g.31154  ORF Transcript_43216/g.31154 Transcript_43216/m.31154 type:complete len:121 (+) Transcript_43216:1851-2213(+)